MKSFALAAFLISLLIFVVWWVARIYVRIGGFDMPTAGWVALFLGVVLSLVVGVGLMVLVFHSNREGYDDRGQNHRD